MKISLYILGLGSLCALFSCSETETSKETPTQSVKIKTDTIFEPVVVKNPLEEDTTWNGTYSIKTGTDEVSRGVIMLKEEGEGSVLVYLSLNSGAPNYSSGSLFTKLIIQNNTAEFLSTTGECNMKFMFSKNTVAITTMNRQFECGFGDNVFYDGIYIRNNIDIPTSYETPEGIQLQFNSENAQFTQNAHLPIYDQNSLLETLLYAGNYWEKLKKKDYESLNSYLIEIGVRERYMVAQKTIGIAVLESIIGEKVYLKGPHENGINFNEDVDFGKYNPVFLEKTNSELLTIFQNEKFKESFDRFYQTELKYLLRTFAHTYDSTLNDDTTGNQYLQYVTDGDGGEFFRNRYIQLAQEISQLDYPEAHWEVSVCAGFWIRRSMDGTAGNFKILLDQIMKAMDPHFFGGNGNKRGPGDEVLGC